MEGLEAMSPPALKESQFVATLQATLNPDPQIQKKAEVALMLDAKREGYSVKLGSVFVNARLDAQTRLAAAVCFKNSMSIFDSVVYECKVGTDKAGNSSSQKPEPYFDLEKANIKHLMLECIRQHSLPKPILAQVAESIAILARREWPTEWEALFHSLADAPPCQGLVVIEHVMDHLSTLRLASARSRLPGASAELLPSIHKQWLGVCHHILQLLDTIPAPAATALAKLRISPPPPATRTPSSPSAPKSPLPPVPLFSAPPPLTSADSPNSGPQKPQSARRHPAPPISLDPGHRYAPTLESLALLSRVTHHLLVHSMPHCTLAKHCTGGLPTSGPGLEKFVRSRAHRDEQDPEGPHPLMDRCSWMMRIAAFMSGPNCGKLPGETISVLVSVVATVGRTANACVKLHPGIFACIDGLVQTMFTFSVRVIESHRLFPTELVIVAANFLSQSISSRQPDLRKAILKCSTKDLIGPLVRFLITDMFPLSPTELQKFQHAPEEFMDDDYRDRKEYAVRPAVQALFWSLLKAHQGVVGPILATLLTETFRAVPVAQPCPQPGTPQFRTVLVKEAVYLACGMASYELSEIFKKSSWSFSTWYNQTLVHEITCKEQGLGRSLLRARVIKLLEEWVCNISNELRPSLYNVLCALIRGKEMKSHIVMRVAAAATLRELVALKSNETIEALEAISPAMVSSLFMLMGDLKELDTKRQIAYVLRSLLNALKERAAVAIRAFTQAFTVVWTACEHANNPLRIELITLLTSLLSTLEAKHDLIRPFVLALLPYCLDPSVAAREYLVDSALDLWYALVCVCEDDQASTVASLAPLLSQCFHKRVVSYVEPLVKVMTAYIYLDPHGFLTNNGAMLSQFLLLPCPASAERNGIKFQTAIARLLHSTTMMYPLVTALPKVMNVLFVSMAATCSQHLQRYTHPIDFTEMTGAERQEHGMSVALVSHNVPILARLLLSHQQASMQCLQKAPEPNKVLIAIATICLRWAPDTKKFILTLPNRKTMLFAAASLLTTLHVAFNDKDLLAFCKELSSACPTVLKLDAPTRRFHGAASPHNRRVAAVNKRDPLQSMCLLQYVTRKFGEVALIRPHLAQQLKFGKLHITQ